MTVLDLDLCHCGQPATRTLGTRPYCDECAEEVLGPIRQRHPSNGQQIGPLRPDYGPGWAELGCTTCGSTWVGHIGEPCSSCMDRLEQDRKAGLVLVPRLSPRTTSDYDDAFSGNGHDDEPDPDAELRNMLIDWPAFWAHDHADAEWIAEPLLPAKRSVALFAPGGTGKSLLALWLAAKLASGVDPFTGRQQPPVDVLYLDYEMTEADLSERLEQMGFGPDADLTHLHYALLPSLPGLDQPDGGKAVVRLAQLCDASLVVVDTFGRAVHGDENDADTVRAWYRWTGLHLKAEGRGFCRVDHAGKDLAKGQRGTSAKNDDVDVVWQMTARDGGVFVLDAKKRRMGWVPLRVEIAMTEEPLTFTLVDDDTWPVGTKEVAQQLDELDIELGLGYRAAGRVLREAGRGARNELIRAALKYRRRRSDTFHFVGDEPTRTGDNKCAPIAGVHCERNNPGAPSGASPTEDLFDQVDGSGLTVGRTGAQDSPPLGLSGALRSGPTGPADLPEQKTRPKPDPNEDF